MELIKQRTPDKDCGVACLAMIAGVSYEDAMVALHKDAKPRRTLLNELVAASTLLEVKLEPQLIPLLGDHIETLSGSALVKTNITRDGWHWVVWDAESKTVLDPKIKPYVRLRPVSYAPFERI